MALQVKDWVKDTRDLPCRVSKRLLLTDALRSHTGSAWEGVVPSPCGSAQPHSHKARQAGAQARVQGSGCWFVLSISWRSLRLQLGLTRK